MKGDHAKAPGHLMGPLPKHANGTTPGLRLSHLWARPTPFTDALPSPWITLPLGLVLRGYVHPDQVPEGKDCGPHVFKWAASSMVPGTWLALKCLLSKRKMDGRISGKLTILRN